MSQEDSWPARREAAADLVPGSLLGDYEIARVIDEGGQAAIYEARHRVQQQRIALKVLSPTHGGHRVELVRRFVREAENAARINHPHVVQVFQVGSAQGTPFLVMELLEGEELSTLLKRVGRLSVEATADLLVPVCCALAAGHDVGVEHRDLKPQNIFLCRTRNGGAPVPKVVHFGAAKLNETVVLARTMSDAIVGTPFYMSPEQTMEADRVDARTDQFSLGVILYECVTGRRPFDSRSLFTVLTSIVHLQQPAMGSEDLPVDPAFEALVERALEKKPDARFASMRELGRALLRFASARVQAAYVAELGEHASGSASARAIAVAPRESRVESQQSERVARTSQRSEAHQSGRVETHKSAREVHESGRVEAHKSGRVPASKSGSLRGSGSAQPLERGGALSSLRELPDGSTSSRRSADSVEAQRRSSRPHGSTDNTRTTLIAWGAAGLIGLAGAAWHLLQSHEGHLPPPPPPVVQPIVPLSVPAVAVQKSSAQDDWSETEAGVAMAQEPVDLNRYSVALEVEPASASFLLDGVYAGTGKTKLSLLRDGRAHKIEVLGYGYTPVVLEFRDEPPTVSRVVLERASEDTSPRGRRRRKH